MYNYELNQHRKKDRIKWIFTGIAFLLVFVMLVGMCLQLFGTGKQKPSEWFKKDETPEPETANNMVVSPIASASKGMRLISRRVAVSSTSGVSKSFTLSVELDPVGATDALDWTVTGNDDNGVTVEVADDMLSATITCNKAFSVQKTVTVTSSANPELTASCTLDYYKRLESISIKRLEKIKLATTATEYTVELEPTWGVGTINDTTIHISGGKIECGSQMKSNTVVYVSGMEVKASEAVTIGSNGKFTLVMAPNAQSSFGHCNGSFSVPTVQQAYFKKFVSNCERYAGPHYTITINWYATRDNGTINNGTVTVNGTFDVSGLAVPANDLSFSQGNFVF